eukprot:m.192212 g.192212  ORF g.192212 m.192212 type:complete len:75 (-) comp53651_c0_seq3:191-415(-)
MTFSALCGVTKHALETHRSCFILLYFILLHNSKSVGVPFSTRARIQLAKRQRPISSSHASNVVMIVWSDVRLSF